MSAWYVKQNDSAGTIEATLVDEDEVAVDLTGATVRFHMRKAGAASAKVNAAATIVTAASGIVRYSWVSGDTDEAGVFSAEWEVTFSGGGRQTFPNWQDDTVTVTAELA